MNYIVPVLLGILCIVIGILNMKGNVSSLHSYHRRRVAEQDIRPFGRLVGLGTVIIGATVILFGAMSFISEQLKMPIFTIVGTVIMIVGIVVGLGLNIYAMIKYNKGIF